jgi:serine/threonine-protein kinase
MPDLLERLKSALADRYAVESEIGRGGMAVVFLAEDLKHHRQVAIKVLHPELAASVGGERFLHEIETVAGLTHPHILTLIDSGESDGLLYYTMPYVEGESLRQRLEREKQLPVEEAIRIAQEVAGALDHAHRNGVIHRDIKPANILLEEGHAVVTDFGVARAISEAGGEKVTATGMAVGTPAYMSPEQASGEEVDERSDLYALGCVLYEVVAGEPPLTGAAPQSTAAKRLTDRPTPLGAIRHTIPANLQTLVERMLATSSADRPATARQLSAELAQVHRSPEPAARRSPVARWLAPVIGLAVIVVMAAVVWMQATDRSATRQGRVLPVGADLGDKSIAVLPFANNTGADSLDWLRIGLADMLTTNLGQLEAIRVVGVERLLDLLRQAGREETDRIPEDLALNIAAASGARTMIRGSVAGEGSTLRMDVRLIDVSDGTIISAERAAGVAVFALVNEVSALLLSRVLGETVTPTELTPVSRLVTGNLDAYREYLEGLRAAYHSQYEQAREHYQRAVELDSTFALAWLRLGMHTFRSNREEQLAISHLERAERLSTDVSERDRLLIQAGLAMVSREWDEAIEYLEILVARYQEEKDGRFWLGWIYFDYRNRPDDGRRLLEEVLALHPYYAPAIADLAVMAAEMGDAVAWDSLSLRHIELEPDQASPYFSRAEVLRAVGRKEEAREIYREVIRRFPDDWLVVESHWRLVETYLSDGDPAGARAVLQPIRSTSDPERAMWMWLMEANIYASEGRYRAALAASRSAPDKARELGPLRSRAAWFHAGIYANATGAYEDAEEAFQELYRLDANRQATTLGILSTYGKQRRFDDMSQVRSAVAADVDAAPGFMRGRAQSLVHFADGLIAWYGRGDAEETVRLFEEGRAVGRFSKTEFLLGHTQGEEVLALIEAGRASDALGTVDGIEGFAANPPSPRILAHLAWYLRGRAYEALGESERALEGYGMLLEEAGDGVREVTLFQDTPERVARLRAEP